MSALRRVGTPSPSNCGRAHRARVGRIVEQLHVRRRDSLADAAREQRTALQHRLAVERARQHAEHRTRDERVEHDRDAPARRSASRRAGGTRGSPRRAGSASRSRSASARPADEAVARLGARAVVGERDRRRRARRATRVRLDAARVGERGLGERVAVARRLDVADPRVGGLRRAFELERDAHLLVGRHRRQAVAPQIELRRPRHRRRRPAVATPYHSSGAPYAALSRASRRVSSMTPGSSEPAHARPWR